MKKQKKISRPEATTEEAPEVKKVKKIVKAEAAPEKTVSKPKVVDKANVEKVKKIKKERKARESAVAPEKLVPTVKEIPNPIVENRRLKRALAVALATLVKDPATLAKHIRDVGIPFKQVQSREQYKNPDLLAKNEWSGMSYAKWALVNGKEYRTMNEDKVAVCMKFAEVVTGVKAPAGVKTEPTIKPKKEKATSEKTPVKKAKKVKKVKKTDEGLTDEDAE